MMDVIGFGALNLDRILLVDKIPGCDEEGFILNVDDCPGGSAANTIVGLSRLGLSAGYLGMVGSDDAGRILLESFSSENVDISGIKIAEGRSGMGTGLVDKKGDRALLIDPGVNDDITMDNIDLDYVRGAGFLHLTSFICRDTDASFKTQLKLVDELDDVNISFDPGQLYAERGLNALKDIIERCKIMFPSENEIRLLTGLDYKQGSELLLEKGANIIVVTRGGEGCYVTDGEQSYEVPAEAVDVIDTTGAGDAFAAGFLYGMVKEKDLNECALLGNKVASYCIQHRGARAGLPMLDMLNI